MNTSIRPGWFYHASEDGKVKSLNHMLKTYYSSVGRNAPLLLNFPIMPNGLIHLNDEKVVLALAETIKKTFAKNLIADATIEASNVRGNSQKFAAFNAIDNNKETYWATNDNITKGSLVINFKKPVAFSRFLVQEYIPLGQRVKAFTLEAFVNGKWKLIDKQTTIGYKRILYFPSVTATKLRFSITDAKACPLISNIEIFDAPPLLSAPAIQRGRSGDVKIIPEFTGQQMFYTLDGSMPTPKSLKYINPIKTNNDKVLVKCIVYDPITKSFSDLATEQFNLSRKKWKIIGETDAKINRVLDGDPATSWFQASEKKMPLDLVIDLGRMENLKGFKYLPDQSKDAPGLITKYVFYVSQDGIKWDKAREGEFSNIKNHPIWQFIEIAPVQARFIKLQALQNTQGDNKVGYAELDVIVP